MFCGIVLELIQKYDVNASEQYINVPERADQGPTREIAGPCEEVQVQGERGVAEGEVWWNYTAGAAGWLIVARRHFDPACS